MEDSVISERWYLQYDKKTFKAILQVIKVESIIDSAFVLQETPGLLPVLNVDNKDKDINKNKSRKGKEKVNDKGIIKNLDTNLVILIHPKGMWAKHFT